MIDSFVTDCLMMFFFVVPLEAPSVKVHGKVGRNHAELTWNWLPPDITRGFITNYTIFYSSDTKDKSAYLSHGSCEG